MAYSIPVFEISRLGLQELETPSVASINEVTTLSSYNWIETPIATPTIVVPGSPARWSARSSPQRLKKDCGLIYIDQNAARHPESPLEPLFRALYAANPSFDIRSTDVVTDRNNIRKLLSFIDPSLARHGLEPFTMTIEMTKNTAIFCRKEDKTQEYIGPQEFRGFGHEFEKAYTISQVRGSTGHHRIIAYQFGGLNFIVRHETDGYVDTDTRVPFPKAEGYIQDELSSGLESLSLFPRSSTSGITALGSELTIKEGGQAVPLESTLEIKTRVVNKPLGIRDIAPQLWISQTPKLVRAYHQNGTFQKPVIEDVSAAIKSWEEREQNHLTKLAGLIRKVIDLAKECGGSAAVRYNLDGDKLVISKVARKDMLPKELYLKWDEKHDLEAETDTQNDGMQGSKIASARQENISAVRNNRKQWQHGTNIETLQMGATGDNPKATIKIGGVEYSINLSKIPYLASFVRLQKGTNPDATEFVHGRINLFDVALKGIESGYRQCFRSLPTNLSQYRTLFETYKFLHIDILKGLSIDEVIANLKVGKADYDPEERRSIPGNKSLARDTAFQLLYLIQRAEFEDEMKVSMKLFNAVMFVVSHPGTFKYRTRRVIRSAYEERFRVTTKQKARLDQWEKGEATSYGTDATTEEDRDYFFDSDDDSF